MSRWIASLGLVVLSVTASSAPALSDKGKARVEENLRTVDANLHDSTENLKNARENLKTIGDELADLDSMEKQHLTLRKKFEANLEQVRLELKKNEELSRDSNETPGATAAAERLKWQRETLTESARIEKEYFDLLKNLQDIQARRAPLETQRETMTDNEKFYASLVQELEAKKARVEGPTDKP